MKVYKNYKKSFLPDATLSGYFPAEAEPSDSEDSMDEEDNLDQDPVDAAQDEVVDEGCS